MNGYTSPYQQEYGQINRNRQLAQAILGQSLAPQQHQTGLTALARILAAKLSGDRISALDTQEQELTNRYRGEQQATFDAFSEALRGKPAVEPFTEQTPYPAMPQAAVPGDRNKAMAVLLGSNNPQFQQVAMAEMLKGNQPFTLGAGQTRFDAQGNPIAINTKQPGDFLGKYNPGDYTVDSWATFTQSNNPNDLVRHQSTPSAIQEWNMFSSLSVPQQEQYLAMKRAQQIETVGGVPSVVKPGGVVQPLSTVTQEAESKATIEGAKTKATTEAKAQAEQEAKAEQKSADYQEISRIANELLDNEDTTQAFGAIQGRSPTIRPSTIDVNAQINRLIGLLSLDSREKMKGSGQISDYESKLLGQSATILQDRNISDERALEELQRIRDIFSGKAAPGGGEVNWNDL